MVTSSTKNDGATGCGKAAEWKSQNTDFSTPLGNPANPAGFPLSHSPDDYGRVTKTGHSSWLRKGDTSNVVRRGTFLLSVDRADPQSVGKLEVKFGIAAGSRMDCGGVWYLAMGGCHLFCTQEVNTAG